MKKYVVINSEPVDLQIHLNEASEKGWDIHSVLGPFVGGTLMVVLEADKRPEIPVAFPPVPVPAVPVLSLVEPPPPYLTPEAPVVVRETADKCSCGEFVILGTEYCGPNGCLEVPTLDPVLEELLADEE